MVLRCDPTHAPRGSHPQCQVRVCAVTRRRSPVGASPTRQPLQPEATGAVMEATKWLKPSDSRYIAVMPFLWLNINDEPGPNSLRGAIEHNTIALLSNHGRMPLDLPSLGWL